MEEQAEHHEVNDRSARANRAKLKKPRDDAVFEVQQAFQMTCVVELLPQAQLALSIPAIGEMNRYVVDVAALGLHFSSRPIL
jgi:hypothetical protein